MRYTCFVKDDKISYQCYQAIDTFLAAYGWERDENEPQLVISIGGDGTVLAAIHKYMANLSGIAFVGIHTGSLGFFNDYRLEEVKEFIQDIISKQPKIEYRNLVQAVVDNDPQKTFYALNEVRIENNIKTQNLQINIDNQVFEVVRGSGICVSTQSGSTAYNRSLGGAVMDEDVAGLQISEIVSIHNSRFHSLRSPLILNPQRRISVVAQDFDYSVLCYDHLFYQLNGHRMIDLSISDKLVYFARFKEVNNIKRLMTLF